MKRVVSYSNNQEWTEVYNEIYSNNSELLQHGLNRIAVWKSRLLHRLSTAVELTWELGTAMLHDSKSSCNSNHRALALQYSMALVRFVNLLTEKNQQKLYAQPIHQLAEQLGLPEWLVELRHDATHSALPHLPYLRTVASFAWNWLKENYWEACLSEDGSKEIRQPTGGNKIADCLSDYMQAQFSAMLGEKVDIKRSTRNCCDTIDKLLEDRSNEEQLADVLLRDTGYLVPTTEQLRALSLDASALEGVSKVQLPRSLQQMWLPVVRYLLQCGLSYSLIRRAMEDVCDVLSAACRLRLCWAAELVNLALELPVERRDLSPQQVISLIDLAMLKPSPPMYHLLHGLLALSSLPKLRKSQLIQLMALMTGESTGRDSKAVTDRTYRLEDVELLAVAAKGTEVDQSSVPLPATPSLSVVKDSQYRYTALGACPGVTITSTNLELPASINGVQHRSEQAQKRKALEDSRSNANKRVRNSEHSTTESLNGDHIESIVNPDLGVRKTNKSTGHRSSFVEEIFLF